LLLFVSSALQLVSIDHKCQEEVLCTLEYDHEGLTYYFERRNEYVNRLEVDRFFFFFFFRFRQEVDRFDGCVLDITNLPRINDIFITYDMNLPADLCQIVTGDGCGVGIKRRQHRK
jgi:hypothetical protein